MTIPRNHHFVSQVLSKKFFSTNDKIWVFNKSSEHIHSKNSSRKLFSQRDLNTTLNEDGNIDHKSVEDELNKSFETDFNKHYNVVIGAINNDLEIGERADNSDEIQESIEYLVGMALIGHSRHPRKMKNSQDRVLSTLEIMAELSEDNLQNEIRSYIAALSGVNNKTPIDFLDLKNGILELMGDVRYGLMSAPENHYFILPDSSSGIKRFPVEPDIIGGEVFLNPSMPIGLALMPLNSKLILTAVSRSLLPDEYKNEPSGLFTLDEKTTEDYNRILFENAFDEVACENEDYLRDFIKTKNAT